jgi:hypothetical protein
VPGRLALYFGYGSGGHFLRSHVGRESTLSPERDHPGFPWRVELLDTGLLKNGKVPDSPDGRVFWTGGGRPEFWFAFYWWDRSGDKRAGSNSGFYVRGFEPKREQAPEAFAFACAEWPEIVARQKFPLRLILDWDRPVPATEPQEGK